MRSLPDLCEFKLEQQISENYEDNTDNSLNYQSETEDENRFKKKQLRHEVKIMLDSRNKDASHNKLKRKELKKTKDQDTKKELKKGEQKIESEFSLEETRLIDSGLSSGLDSRSQIDFDAHDNKLTDKIDKENYDVFLKLDKNNQDQSFFRQSSVIDFGRNELRNQSNDHSLSKQNNLNKWRNTILNDEAEDDLFDSPNVAFNKRQHLNQSELSKELSKELNYDEDSGYHENNLNKTFDQTSNKRNQIEIHQSNNRNTIQLNDIQLKLNADCLIKENLMYRRIENALLFHVNFVTIGWHGRLGKEARERLILLCSTILFF